jgi:uncharacterized repeat protein (TIGR03803 family)
MHNNDGKILNWRAVCSMGALFAALVVAAAPSASAAASETVLYAFTSNAFNGPTTGVIMDSAGNLYGTTTVGGAYGAGSVYKLSPGGTLTELYSFTGGVDGNTPDAGLIADNAGNLYGTTAFGGAYSNGVVFKLTPAGTETTLYSFTGGNDGGNPFDSLVFDGAGNLYGTTEFGGAYSNGMVFKLTPAGTETTLYSFTGGSDGAYPVAGLIFDSAGNLYGTTELGGGSCCGVVFKLTPTGTETVLHSFTGGNDGGMPIAGVIADSAGNLYGTTFNGGAYGFGVVFKLTPTGTETPLYSFTGGNDGGYLYGGVILDSAGNLYGTTIDGGAYGWGTAYKVTPGGTETVLYSFTGGNDGGEPVAGVIADSAGNLYSTTGVGGADGNGVIFKLSATGFVTTIPFSAFQAALAIEFGLKPNTSAFQLLSDFTPGQGGTISPLTQAVTLQVGTFTTTIPAGSFQAAGSAYFYIGTINGVQLDVVIAPLKGGQYTFDAAAANASLTGTANPVTVKLTIGNNTGTVSVTALIL